MSKLYSSKGSSLQINLTTSSCSKECRALFPTIASLSITKSTLITQKENLIALTAVIYDIPRSLSLSDQQKLMNWLNQRLMVKDVELFKNQ
jgi:hypothetical protein